MIVSTAQITWPNQNNFHYSPLKRPIIYYIELQLINGLSLKINCAYICGNLDTKASLHVSIIEKIKHICI